MSKIAVNCNQLTKNYGETTALQEIGLAVPEEDFLALVGPSGCGKTTLLRLIAGFDVPDKGLIKISGLSVVGPGKFVPPQQREVGIVFQDLALFPHMNVYQNIAYGFPEKVDRSKRVKEMLSLMGMEGYGDRMPHQLSGGEKQRVATARALGPSPEVLLLDEPFSNLDADLRVRIRREIRKILKRASATVVFVTHDQREAMFMGDWVGVMENGSIRQLDRPEAVFHSPQDLFVAQFIGKADVLAGSAKNGHAETELGNLPVQGMFPPDTPVKVLIRPAFLDIYPEEEGKGEIIERIFRGDSYLYKVSLPSGAAVRVLQAYTEKYEVGQQVGFETRHEDKFPCFPQNQ